MTRTQAAMTCNAITSAINKYRKMQLKSDSALTAGDYEYKIIQLTEARDELKEIVHAS